MIEETKLPTVTLSESTPPAKMEAIAGIVLAAGTSSRFGEANKLLAEINGKTIVTQSTQLLTESEIAPVYVVVGNEHRHIQEAIKSLDACIIFNEEYSQGQATSVQTGIEAVRQSASVDAAVITLGDMPFVKPSTINQLVTAYELNIADIVVAGYQGQRGNPVLIDASYFGVLTTLSGDTGARHLVMESDDAILVETGDPGVVQDIDTPLDLDRFT